MLIVIAAGVFLSLALSTYAALVHVEDRAVVRSSLRRLRGYDLEDLRRQELLEPVTKRLLGPLARRLVGLAHRFMPAGYMERVRRKLVLAGRPSVEDLDRFRAIRMLTLALVPVELVLAAALPAAPRMRLLLFLAAASASVLGPDAILNREAAARQRAIRLRLPDVLDLLVISVEAGLGFEQALDRTVDAVPGPLADELGRMLGEVQAGSTRADALRALDERVDVAEVRSFILAILQADTFGVSIGRVLRTQAEEIRIKRRQLAQEDAQKAPVKMLFPMVLCIFPALFVIVLGPAVINILKTL